MTGNPAWETVARKKISRRKGWRPWPTATLVISIRDTTVRDGYFPSVKVTLFNGGTTTSMNKLFSVGHQPRVATKNADGLSLYDTFAVVKDALTKFVKEAQSHIHEQYMKQSDAATVEQHLEMATYTDAVDEVFALADELREVQ